MKKKKTAKVSDRNAIFILIVLTIVVVFLNPQTSNMPKDDELLAIVSEDSQVIQFVSENSNYGTKIIMLEPLIIKSMAKEQPVIYGDLPEKVLYEIKYNSSGKGLLVIVDFEEKKVLKTFRTAAVSLM